MPVAIYARVSTEEQRERQSIETQLQAAKKYCKDHDLTVARVFTDDGVSGTVPLEKRPQGNRILAEARRGTYDELIVFKLDRLGRETRIVVNAVADLNDLGVRIHSLTETFDASPSGMLMTTILSGFAAHERQCIRDRSIAGTNRVAQSGAWMGGVVPFGYRKIGTRGEARLVVADEKIPGNELSEAEVIRMIYRLSAVERQSCFFIAESSSRRLRLPGFLNSSNRSSARGFSTATWLSSAQAPIANAPKIAIGRSSTTQPSRISTAR